MLRQKKLCVGCHMRYIIVNILMVFYHHHQYRPVGYPLQDKVSSSNIEGLGFILSESPSKDREHKNQSTGESFQANGMRVYVLESVIAVH